MLVGVAIATLGKRDMREVFAAWQAQTDKNFVLSVDLDTVGYATVAFNRAYRAVLAMGCEIVTFQNDDTYPAPDFVEHLRQIFQSTIRRLGEDMRLEEEGKSPEFVEFTLDGGITPMRPWGFTVCSCAYRAQALQNLDGPLDENFRRGGWRADTDLGWRLLRAGVTHHFDPRPRITHPESGHSRLDAWNERYLARKHPMEYHDRIRELDPGYYRRVRDRALREREEDGEKTGGKTTQETITAEAADTDTAGAEPT